MKKLIIAIFSLSITLSSCEKKDNAAPGSSTGITHSTTGTVQMVNNSSNPYTVECTNNGFATFTQAEQSSQNKTLKNGSYTIKVTQNSGYIVYPTVNSFNVTVNSNNSVVSYPQ